MILAGISWVTLLLGFGFVAGARLVVTYRRTRHHAVAERQTESPDSRLR